MIKKSLRLRRRLLSILLLFDDLQNFHGADLYADTAGDALGNGVAFLQFNAVKAVLQADHNAGYAFIGCKHIGARPQNSGFYAKSSRLF